MSISSIRIAALLTLAGLAHGQSITGTIVGTVTDASNAPVSAAVVLVRNNATQATRSVPTNGQGDYAATLLTPGSYTISVEHPGFKPVQLAGIEVKVDRSVRADLKLQLGDVKDSITVSAASNTKVETDTSTLNQTLSQRNIVSIPIARSFVSLASLTVGVVPVTGENGQSLQTSFTNRGNLSAFVSGQRESSVSFLIDGVESRGERLGNASMPVSVDAIQEFGMLRNTMSAEYGNASAVMNISVKSGSNQVHGTLFEFLQNSVLNARNFFNTTTKAQVKVNDFGVSVGGPIIKNKTFFFTNYEGVRSRTSTPLLALVPTAQELSGNLSSLGSLIYDPLTTAANGVRTPFAGNIIPSSRLDPGTQNFAKYIPVANLAQPINNSNLSVSPSAIADSNQTHFRIDHYLGNNDQIFVRWSSYDAPNTAPAIEPLWGQQYPWTTYNGALQETHIFGAGTLNEFRFGFSRDNIFQEPAMVAGTNLAQSIGLKNTVPNAPDGGALPAISVAGYNITGGSRPTGYISNRFQYSDLLSLTRGSHVLKVGVDIRRLQYDVFSSTSPNGTISFSKIFTTQTAGGTTGGDALADYLLGAFNSATGALTVNSPAFRNSTFNGFIQDEWKVTRRLHLSLGLRYEYAQKAYDVHNKIAVFNFSTGNEVFARENPFDPTDTAVNPSVNRSLLDPNNKNFAPRFGFSFDAGKDTVIRGGFGIFYDVTQANELNFLGFVPPFQTVISLVNNPLAGVPSTYFSGLFPNAAPPNTIAPGTATFSFIPTDGTPYVEQFNFNVQKRILSNYLAEFSYVGSLGRKQSKRRNFNQKRIDAAVPYIPYPNWGPILTSERNSNSSYNAFQARLERQFKSGWSLLANYTYSKSIDLDSAGAGTDENQDASNIAGDRGLSDFDVRHRFSANGTYELPFGPGKHWLSGIHGVTRVLAAGWQTSAIASMQSGFPLTISASDTSGAGADTSLRANRIGNGNLPSDQRTILEWFNTSAFVAPTPGKFGTAGRNIIIGPGIDTWNLAAMKNTAIKERFNLQFRAEFFNAFNHTQFFAPGTSVSSPLQFGRITSARAPRNIQLALKLYF